VNLAKSTIPFRSWIFQHFNRKKLHTKDKTSLEETPMQLAHRNQRFRPPLFFAAALLLLAVAAYARGPKFIPNGSHFPDSDGTVNTYSTAGALDLTGPFFESLGTNGRSCATCHQPSDGMSVSAAHIQERFDLTDGLDPIFRTVDGSNCDHDVNVTSVEGRRAAYSLLRNRGLIRIALQVPANSDYQVVSVDNQYSCSEGDKISMYRRPLPATNLRFLSAVMWDGREANATTGTKKILSPDNAGYEEDALQFDLRHQSLDATNGHAQGLGNRPTPAEQQQIVDFEMGLFTAQATENGAGTLAAYGATGGAEPLVTDPFYIGINSQIPAFENPLSGPFNPAIFNIFSAWADMPPNSGRASVARGEALFDSKPINITGVSGLNDDLRLESIQGTCGTCHDTPNVGNHSFPTPLDIGVGDFATPSTSLSKGGLDLSYLPRITACRINTADCVTTTDLGQALIDGKFEHVGKLKGPILRGLSARAPYFHNGSAQTLLDVMHFYEVRFGMKLTPQEEADFVAFLNSL
jgi:cytochrome c peroxidase